VSGIEEMEQAATMERRRTPWFVSRHHNWYLDGTRPDGGSQRKSADARTWSDLWAGKGEIRSERSRVLL